MISGRNDCQHVVSTPVAGCDRSLSRVSKGARANNCHGPRLALIRHWASATILHAWVTQYDAVPTETLRASPASVWSGRWVSPLLTGVGRWLTKCFLVEPLALHPFTYLLQLVYIGRFGSRWLVDTLQLLTTWRRHYRVESKQILGYLANENDLRCLEATTKLSRSTRYEPSPFQKWKKRNTVCRIAFFSELTRKSGVKIMLTTNFAPKCLICIDWDCIVMQMRPLF